MSYTISYLKDEKIIQVNIQGRVNFSLAQQYSMEAINLAREYNCRKFLINHSETILESGIYKIHTDGAALEKFGFTRRDKIAVIISIDDKDSHLSETSDPNVNWSNFKYFNAFDKAVQWLGEDN